MKRGTPLDFDIQCDDDAPGEPVAPVFGVAEYIEGLNALFKTRSAKVTGEISQVKRAVSGHVYFTVKDKGGGAALDCIIWARNYQLCGIEFAVGMEVILSGHPNIYAPSGRFSFVADTAELVGEGALKKAYDALRKKLEAEGVFAPARKRPLPEFPRRIGVITSMKGAVIHDFENNLGKFGFVVSVIDSRVEGQQAVAPLLDAMRTMRSLAVRVIDVLVVIRGGGSLESLQAFNNEALVRAIVDFPVPVIAGIGHDEDVPLAALAADFMTSTPTAAAHLLSRPWEEAYAKLRSVGHLFVRVETEIARVRADLDLARRSMFDHVSARIAWIAERLEYADRSVRLSDPAHQLRLGYSIVRQNGKVMKSVRSVRVGDCLDVQLADGSLGTKVEKL